MNIDNSVLVFQSCHYLVNSIYFDFKDHVDLLHQEGQGFLNIEEDKRDQVKLLTATKTSGVTRALIGGGGEGGGAYVHVFVYFSTDFFSNELD